MKLKYYLRGAGIGFIVSAILFAVFLTALDWGPRQGHVSANEASIDDPMMGDTVKEAQEKKEAEKLEETTKTSEAEDKTDVTDSVEKKEDKKEEKPEVIVPTQTKTDADVNTTEETNPDDTKPVDDKKVTGNVKFSIKDGEASNAIANNLQSLGLVDDAKAFDQFLSEKGYDHHLRTGEFNLSTDMSYEELALALTKKQ